MSNLAETSSYLSGLRERATTKLTDGMRSDLSRASTSEAMAVLFKLASSPSTAGDALALLHELQVHQVEVDMQHEELRRSRVELESDLIRQTAHIERAPAAFLVVDEATVLFEINLAGARLLGAESNEVLGRPLASLLSAAGGEQLRKMLALARGGAVPETFELPLLPQGGVSRRLLCTADREVSSGRFLLVLLAPPSPC
ncbi:PAS domain-containing protein [Hydrogenophaga sp. SL48]|uniref:PAS domain-containing protein n=1 Tax=Hydrogenophaga sp. SL48 TaxID=2806347 RepID=UPI001F2837F5|nr:PAS domain-containing protein [Hydrogenophaga sp. SL48]UJW82027.1 PAS domain-containing protein [Hydrogenophaga sp. SL48]